MPGVNFTNNLTKCVNFYGVLTLKKENEYNNTLFSIPFLPSHVGDFLSRRAKGGLSSVSGLYTHQKYKWVIQFFIIISHKIQKKEIG